MLSSVLRLITLGLLAWIWPAIASAEITIGSELEARILLDNSGSMFPGYAPPGRSGPSLAESGGRYYAQYPEFAGWVNDFVAAQTILGVHSLSLASFTSTGSFKPSDVRFLHRSTPLDRFNFASLRSQLPVPGRHTYLTESLEQASIGFEGILWLITDNIVEDRRGVPDQGVARFFRTLSESTRYRAIHLYKLPFADIAQGKPGNLAIYGILVSPNEVDGNVLRYFDRKFRGDFLRAPRRGTTVPIFRDGAYWKLKDLSVGALELEVRPTLEVEIVQQDRNLFRERKMVRLELKGSVASRLTQHRVTAGSFEIKPRGAFRPEGNTGEDYGLDEAPAEYFDGTRANLPRISPRESIRIQAELRSNRPIPLETEGFGAWLRSASSGLEVTYRGYAEAHFQDLVAEFDRTQMAGIFGAESAPEIFRIPSRIEIAEEISNPAPIEFQLTSGYGRQLLFALLVLLIGGLAVAVYFFFFRTIKYRVVVGTKEQIVALHRGASRKVKHAGLALGRLRRALGGTSHFEPNQHRAGLQVTPSSTPGRFDVVLRDSENLVLEISEIGGGPIKLLESGPSRDRLRSGESRRDRGRISRPGSASISRDRSYASEKPPPKPPSASKERPAARPSDRSRPSRPTIGRPR